MRLLPFWGLCVFICSQDAGRVLFRLSPRKATFLFGDRRYRADRQDRGTGRADMEYYTAGQAAVCGRDHATGAVRSAAAGEGVGILEQDKNRIMNISY